MQWREMTRRRLIASSAAAVLVIGGVASYAGVSLMGSADGGGTVSAQQCAQLLSDLNHAISKIPDSNAGVSTLAHIGKDANWVHGGCTGDNRTNDTKKVIGQIESEYPAITSPTAIGQIAQIHSADR